MVNVRAMVRTLDKGESQVNFKAKCKVRMNVIIKLVLG